MSKLVLAKPVSAPGRAGVVAPVRRVGQHGGVTLADVDLGRHGPGARVETHEPGDSSAPPAVLEGEGKQTQPGPGAVAAVTDLVAAGGVAVLSGAGLSTESGIPDYRGPTGRARRAQPMTYQTFVGSAAARRRYWARSHLGWRSIAAAEPNAGHRAVSQLQRHGFLAGIITQNVDGLHQAAGARDVTELHGSLYRVVCLDCRRRTPREELDRRLRAANPDWEAGASVVNPDGDAILGDDDVVGFRVVGCAECGGVLKPDVVFFGENVPPPRVEQCYRMVESARSLIVLGSSLAVMSGYRFVRHAARLRIPVAIVNRGPTRGDSLASVTIDAPLGHSLTGVLTRVAGG